MVLIKMLSKKVRSRKLHANNISSSGRIGLRISISTGAYNYSKFNSYSGKYPGHIYKYSYSYSGLHDKGKSTSNSRSSSICGAIRFCDY